MIPQLTKGNKTIKYWNERLDENGIQLQHLTT